MPDSLQLKRIDVARAARTEAVLDRHLAHQGDVVALAVLERGVCIGREQAPDQVLVALSDRGGPFRDIHRSFLRAIGSPNYFNHDCTCARNVQHASLSLFGSGRKTFNYDYGKCKHLVLYGRNVLESMRVKNANTIMELLDRGGRLTYIDIRASGTAMKLDGFVVRLACLSIHSLCCMKITF